MDALGTEEVQQKQEVPQMGLTFPVEKVALLVNNLGPGRTSNKLRDIIIRYVAGAFRAAFGSKGVHVTDVLVVVPAAMYNEYHRASVEARLITVTIYDDKERCHV